MTGGNMLFFKWYIVGGGGGGAFRATSTKQDLGGASFSLDSICYFLSNIQIKWCMIRRALRRDPVRTSPISSLVTPLTCQHSVKDPRIPLASSAVKWSLTGMLRSQTLTTTRARAREAKSCISLK